MTLRSNSLATAFAYAALGLGQTVPIAQDTGKTVKPRDLAEEEPLRTDSVGLWNAKVAARKARKTRLKQRRPQGRK